MISHGYYYGGTMSCYIITFALKKPEQDYIGLCNKIEEFGSSWRCFESTWIIKHLGPATTIRDVLSNHIGQDDKLFISKLTGEAAWTLNGDKESSKWLLNNL